MADNQIESISWTPKQIKFQAWLIKDEYDRIPATQKEFAKILGVTEETLSRWKKRPGWNDAIAKKTWEYVGSEFPQIINALIRGAKKENIEHIRTILELLNYLKPESKNGYGDINIFIAESHNYLDPTETAPSTGQNGARVIEVQRSELR